MGFCSSDCFDTFLDTVDPARLPGVLADAVYHYALSDKAAALVLQYKQKVAISLLDQFIA